MALFNKRKKSKNQPADVAAEVFNDKYREELRQMGRQHFKALLDESSSELKTDINAILEQLTGSLRRHMASQLDLAITRVNNDISNQLKEKMNEYNRVSAEAQELVIQSLSRNAQVVHEKYQQMSTNLQQVIANQEVSMVGVFENNKTRVSRVETEQDEALEHLKSSLESTRRQSEEVLSSMRQQAEEQAQKVDEIYRLNIDKSSEMNRAQEEGLSSLRQSVESLQSQHQQLQKLIDDSIEKHRTMATELVNENMARIIEHYLVNALGERSDVTKDLPNILERLEDSKQAMMDDMKL